MSKHSKWAKIKRKKEATDTKKGAAFTKLTNNITLAVKEGGGGDPNSNFKLRLTVDAARAQNVPKENIERAIARGLGKAGGAALEQLLFEGYGPEKIAVMVETTTDSRNRTVSEVKHLFSAHEGSMGSTGSVAWQFEKHGVVRITNYKLPITNDTELALIDAGADEIQTDDDVTTILTAPENLQHLKEAVEQLHLTVDEAGLEWLAKETVSITDPEAQQRVAEFLGALEEHDDVTGVYCNAAI